MGNADSGMWRLLIYAISFILVFGLIMNLTVKPFVDNGIPAPNNISTLGLILNTTIQTGVPFNLNITVFGFGFNTASINPTNYLVPQDVKDFLSDQVYMFFYLPTILQYPILIILIISIAYVIILIIASFIP